MAGYIFIIFVSISALIGYIMVERKQQEGLARYWARRCAGTKWKRRFPLASKNEIRAFLGMFTDAFAIRPNRRMCFEPDDRVMNVYEAIYPPGWALAGAFELEDFVQEIKRRYGVNVTPFWNDAITLGELFNLTMKDPQNIGTEHTC